MIKVKATREGLVGQRTASGYVIDTVVPFVALPCADALQHFVRIRNPRNGNTCLAIVLDVGPWNTDDASYVFGGQRPQVEQSPTDKSGRQHHGAPSIWARPCGVAWG